MLEQVGSLILVGLIVFGIIQLRKSKKNRELEAKEKIKQGLLDKYAGDIEIVENILGKKIWQGQTAEQLLDSIGKPVDVDTQVLKTKTKETWKYNQVASNQFTMRIYLEDGVVIGWDDKRPD